MEDKKDINYADEIMRLKKERNALNSSPQLSER